MLTRTYPLPCWTLAGNSIVKRSGNYSGSSMATAPLAVARRNLWPRHSATSQLPMPSSNRRGKSPTLSLLKSSKKRILSPGTKS